MEWEVREEEEVSIVVGVMENMLDVWFRSCWLDARKKNNK